jgi:hypothetical protein
MPNLSSNIPQSAHLATAVLPHGTPKSLSFDMVVLRRLDIALPLEEAEQTMIAAILTEMDTEIAALDARPGGPKPATSNRG